jgi:hypothetical protein
VDSATNVTVVKCELDGVEGERSALAQQLSACACVIACVVARSLAAECIGHRSFLTQHAIRASAVFCHPAHCVQAPAESAMTATRATRRGVSDRTCQGCWTSATESIWPGYEQQEGPQHALASGFRARMNALATLSLSG